MQVDDVLVLYTDGVIEAFHESGEEFGEERLMDTLCRCRSLSASQIAKAIADKVAEFGGREQYVALQMAFHPDPVSYIAAWRTAFFLQKIALQNAKVKSCLDYVFTPGAKPKSYCGRTFGVEVDSPPHPSAAFA